MQKFGMLRVFINSYGKDRDPHNVHYIYNNRTRKNKEHGSFKPGKKRKHKGEKKDHYAQGITTLYDPYQKVIIDIQFH